MMTSSQDESKPAEFQYFISTKSSVVVVTFVGELNNKSVERLEALQGELAINEQAKHFIFYFRDVPNVTMDAVPIFTHIQKQLRSRGQLRLCSVSPNLREKLIKIGVIRHRELINNLQLALTEIADSKK